MPTECRICGKKDSPAHLFVHMGEVEMPFAPEEKISFLVKLATVANTINPHISTPYALEVATEIEFADEETEGALSQSADSLSFDVDENQ